MFTLRSSDVTIFSLARKSMVMTHISSIVWLEFTNNLGGDNAAIWRERHYDQGLVEKDTCLGYMPQDIADL